MRKQNITKMKIIANLKKSVFNIRWRISWPALENFKTSENGWMAVEAERKNANYNDKRELAAICLEHQIRINEKKYHIEQISGIQNSTLGRLYYSPDFRSSYFAFEGQLIQTHKPRRGLW